MNFFKSFYLTPRAFFVLGICIALFCIGLVLDLSFTLGKLLLFILFLIVLIESILLYSISELISSVRILPNRLSNGDENQIELQIRNNSAIDLSLTIYEDLPDLLQLRIWKLVILLKKAISQKVIYKIKPTQRGIYTWQNTNILCSVSFLRFVARRMIFESITSVSCYPSFEQFKKLPINALTNNFSQISTTNIRKIGQSLEFEQIKDYVNGDNYRHINWKASAKQGRLMLNQYQAERSQDIYMVLDMGRSMKMPFNRQTLLDYAINGTIALTKSILDVKDKAGLITFSSKNCAYLSARSDYKQFGIINDMLYNLTTDFLESDFERLYKFVRFKVRQRSLLIIFTNFDSINSLKRNLQYLKAIAKYHLVLVVFFENSEIVELVNQPVNNLREVYSNTIGKHFLSQNELILKELVKSGIQGLISQPHLLSIEAINKYLQIKRRQMI
ncbi:DUF58 domain-containing protein [Emticicia sp. BO119]|uniref:DUF58 domain-containing protein n=1 Tax=Emticicia sp. BO119 TaxID=2757768 RepID=UPI0015EFFA11|nr:DUF58 domain-containing protein [Emticicia sp. BO119]MBA4852640.1 DUF58 domain-containing protein [Emticicia sp. BO119]